MIDPLKAKQLEAILEQLDPQVSRIWHAYKVLMQMYNGNGDIEIHLSKGTIKTKHGVYIKPAWTDEEHALNLMREAEKKE